MVFLPAVQALQERIPDGRIALFTSPVALRLYQVSCPGVEVCPWDTAAFNSAWRRPVLLARLMSRIRAFKPDACLLGDDQGSVAHLLALWSGARVHVGPESDRVRLNRLVRDRVPPVGTEHVARHNWRIAQRMGSLLSLRDLPVEIPPPDLTAFGREAHGGVVIHAGASRPYKCWPITRYVALANRLAAAFPVVWFDQQSSEESLLGPGIRRVNSGKLDDLIRHIAGGRYFVGNNSGPMNVASALGVPGTILNGPSTPNWDPPWHADKFDVLRDPELACQPCDWITHPVNICQNKRNPMACMDRWSVEEVHSRVERRLMDG